MSAAELDRAGGVLAAGTWTLDPAASTARFSVRNLGVHRVTGTVPLTAGSVEVDGGGAVVVVTGEADAAGVDTGSARRDADLRAARLLSVGTDRVWTFRGGAAGDGAAPGIGGTLRIAGTLRVRRECAVVWAGVLRREGDGAVRVSATTRLDRRDAGVSAPRVLVGREVDVTLDLLFRPRDGTGG